MRINHLDLPVPDVIASRDFFTTFFGFSHERTLGQGGLAILTGSDGMTLVLSTLRHKGSQTYPEGFHIGFYLEDRSQVIALHRRLATETTLTLSEPSEQRNIFGFYFTAPGNHLIEVSVRLSPRRA